MFTCLHKLYFMKREKNREGTKLEVENIGLIRGYHNFTSGK